MSPTFKDITDKDLSAKTQEADVLLATELTIKRKLKSVRVFIAGAFTLSLLALDLGDVEAKNVKLVVTSGYRTDYWELSEFVVTGAIQ